jgi:thymidylate synthase
VNRGVVGYSGSLAFDDMDYGWPALLRGCLDNGQPATPRGYGTLEQLGVSFVLTEPSRAVVTCQKRKLNHAFGAAEFLWVASGQDEVETLAFYNSNIRQFADQDKIVRRPGKPEDVIHNARFFGAYGPPIVAQLPYVMEALDDRDSRQAVITIWRPSPPKTRDVPCTVMLQFLLRRDRLHAMAVMRSNDLWLGTPYDVPLFCRLQSLVASRLGVGLGTYTHVAGSLHLYDRDRDAALECEKPRHVGIRPANLFVGPFDPAVNPELVWRMVEGHAAGGEALTQAEGWRDLVDLTHGYAQRKRAREVAGG